MADFTSVPWSTPPQGFRAATGLHNEGPIGRNRPAWGPFWSPAARHIFVRGCLERRDFRRGPYTAPITAGRSGERAEPA